MDKLYPIIRRKRLPLQAVTMPEAPPPVTVCPHCGKSSAESVPDGPPSNVPPAVTETVQPVPVVETPSVEPPVVAVALPAEPKKKKTRRC